MHINIYKLLHCTFTMCIIKSCRNIHSPATQKRKSQFGSSKVGSSKTHVTDGSQEERLERIIGHVETTISSQKENHTIIGSSETHLKGGSQEEPLERNESHVETTISSQKENHTIIGSSKTHLKDGSQEEPLERIGHVDTTTFTEKKKNSQVGSSPFGSSQVGSNKTQINYGPLEEIMKTYTSQEKATKFTVKEKHSQVGSSKTQINYEPLQEIMKTYTSQQKQTTFTEKEKQSQVGSSPVGSSETHFNNGSQEELMKTYTSQEKPTFTEKETKSEVGSSKTQIKDKAQEELRKTYTGQEKPRKFTDKRNKNKQHGHHIQTQKKHVETRQCFFQDAQNDLTTITTFHQFKAKCYLLKQIITEREYTFQYPEIILTNIDKISLELRPKHATWLQPYSIYGDGNCLPRCGSVAAVGNQDSHVEIRVRIAIEMALHEEDYMSPSFLAQGLDNGDQNICSLYIQFIRDSSDTEIDTYRKETMATAKSGLYSSMFHIHALANVIHLTVESIYPDGYTMGKFLNRRIVPRLQLKGV